MRKPLIIWFICALAVMIALPGVAWNFLPGKYGFAFSILLFYTLDPVFAFITGLYAGCNLRQLWWTCLVTGTLFICGAWIFIAPMNMDFLIYAGFYMAVAAIVMGFTAAIRSRWRIRQERKMEEERRRKR